jgi:LytR cell envelope-related transcriptional attenuator
MSTRSYRRRRRGPVTVLVAVLAVAAVGIWTTVLLTAGRTTAGAACPPPAAGSVGQVVGLDTLASAQPVPPSAVPVTVLNAGGQRGQANLVAAQLGDLGFRQAGAPDNDKAFPDGNMDCVAEIRFGAAGLQTASTVALLVPCAQLVRDARQGPAVDLAIGTAFGDLNPSRAARDALDQLGAPPAGGGAAAPTQAAHAVDAATLQAARRCT